MPTVDTGAWSLPRLTWNIGGALLPAPPAEILPTSCSVSAQDWKLTEGEVSADKIPQGKVAVSVTTINYGGGW